MRCLDRLSLTFGAGNISFGLFDFFFQRFGRLLHAVQRLQLERVDGVHSVVNVLERSA